jgi:hypothetical protein
MCFTVTKSCTKPLIAEEDIVCYKAFDYFRLTANDISWQECIHHEQKESIGFISSWQNFPYEYGKEYSLKVFSESKYSPGQELHNGFHSFIEPVNIFGYDGRYVIPCIIPKGTRYMKELVEDITEGKSTYISEKIIIGTKEQVKLAIHCF